MNPLNLCILIFCVSSLFSNDDLRNSFQQAGFETIPSDSATAEHKQRLNRWQNPKNDMQYRAKRDLGEQFFFDPRLSKTKNLSCHSCHQLSQAGTDGLTSSIGFLGMVNPHKFNTPTILNAGLHKLFFWDGRSKSLFL